MYGVVLVFLAFTLQSELHSIYADRLLHTKPTTLREKLYYSAALIELSIPLDPQNNICTISPDTFDTIEDIYYWYRLKKIYNCFKTNDNLLELITSKMEFKTIEQIGSLLYLCKESNIGSQQCYEKIENNLPSSELAQLDSKGMEILYEAFASIEQKEKPLTKLTTFFKEYSKLLIVKLPSEESSQPIALLEVKMVFINSLNYIKKIIGYVKNDNGKMILKSVMSHLKDATSIVEIYNALLLIKSFPQWPVMKVESRIILETGLLSVICKTLNDQACIDVVATIGNSSLTLTNGKYKVEDKFSGSKMLKLSTKIAIDNVEVQIEKELLVAFADTMKITQYKLNVINPGSSLNENEYIQLPKLIKNYIVSPQTLFSVKIQVSASLDSSISNRHIYLVFEHSTKMRNKFTYVGYNTEENTFSISGNFTKINNLCGVYNAYLQIDTQPDLIPIGKITYESNECTEKPCKLARAMLPSLISPDTPSIQFAPVYVSTGFTVIVVVFALVFMVYICKLGPNFQNVNSMFYYILFMICLALCLCGLVKFWIGVKFLDILPWLLYIVPAGVIIIYKALNGIGSINSEMNKPKKVEETQKKDKKKKPHNN